MVRALSVKTFSSVRSETEVLSRKSPFWHPAKNSTARQPEAYIIFFISFMLKSYLQPQVNYTLIQVGIPYRPGSDFGILLVKIIIGPGQEIIGRKIQPRIVNIQRKPSAGQLITHFHGFQTQVLYIQQPEIGRKRFAAVDSRRIRGLAREPGVVRVLRSPALPMN